MKNWEKKKRGDVIIYAIVTIGPFQISVHRDVHSSPDIWFLSCTVLNIKSDQLASKDLDQACCQAGAKIQVMLEGVVNQLASIGDKS